MHIRQVDGKPTSGPDLSVEVNGLHLPNPFVIGSGAAAPTGNFLLHSPIRCLLAAASRCIPASESFLLSVCDHCPAVADQAQPPRICTCHAEAHTAIPFASLAQDHQGPTMQS